MRAGRGSWERAALARGSATLSAAPRPTSLVTFLFGDKKVTPSLAAAPMAVRSSQSMQIKTTTKSCFRHGIHTALWTATAPLSRKGSLFPRLTAMRLCCGNAIN